MSSIDCVLQRIYCDPCNIPCVRPRCCHQHACCSCAWENYSANCGCQPHCNVEGTLSPMKATDPFQDDDLRSPPLPPRDARNARSNGKTTLTRLRVTSYSEPPAKKTPKEDVSPDKSSIRPANAVIPMEKKCGEGIQPASLANNPSQPYPKNPLRDSN